MADELKGIYIPELINDEYYVPPDTDIFILRGVPLDNTYEHTIVWENLDAVRTKQTQYFLSKAKYGIKKNYYQRVDREWMKISVNAEYLYDCNYIMFRNTAFNEVKWWYGFILDVEYINNNTAKIRYEIDVMQTWLPGANMDYQPMPCFVERCHAKSDGLYENLVPENIVNSTDYVVDNSQSYDMNKLSIVVLVTEVYSGVYDVGSGGIFDPPDGIVEYNSYGKVDFQTYDVLDWDGNPNLTAIRQLDTFLNAYINGGKENSVIAMYMCPSQFAYSGQIAEQYSVEVPKPMPGQPLGGNGLFIPKNNKLYSYPFNILTVNNQCGTVKTYKWELFDSAERGKFTVAGVPVWMPCVTIFPNKYRNLTRNMEESVSFDNSTICPWGSDAFRAWWAQNAGHVGAEIFGGIGSVVAAIAGAATMNPMLAAVGIGGAVSSATKVATSVYEGEHQPARLHGQANNSLILPALRNLKFIINKESLKEEMLRIYDDYFTKYGYAQKVLMVPPRVNREHWTYVQTVGFEFTGEINDNDTKKIKSIYDNGVTFWRNPSEVGNYALTNDPLV